MKVHTNVTYTRMCIVCGSACAKRILEILDHPLYLNRNPQSVMSRAFWRNGKVKCLISFKLHQHFAKSILLVLR